MTNQSALSDINKRIAALVDRLAERLGQFSSIGEISVDHAEKARDIGEKANRIRQNLPESEGSVWDGIADEIERDVHALEQDFDHWVRYLDKHFEEQGRKD